MSHLHKNIIKSGMFILPLNIWGWNLKFILIIYQCNLQKTCSLWTRFSNIFTVEKNGHFWMEWQDSMVKWIFENTIPFKRMAREETKILSCLSLLQNVYAKINEIVMCMYDFFFSYKIFKILKIFGNDIFLGQCCFIKVTKFCLLKFCKNAPWTVNF